MAIPPTRVDNFSSSMRREPSSSSSADAAPAAVIRESRYILARDLDAAIKQLDDQELDRLVSAVLEERARRKKPAALEGSQRKRQDRLTATHLPKGKLNAVRAAFKAGVTPSRIAREFGISQSDVQKALMGEAQERMSLSASASRRQYVE
jgi:hypothetical protein